MQAKQLDLTGFPPRDPNRFLMFGYEGYCVDLALRRDDADMIERCFRNDWIDHTTKMFEGQRIRAWAERVAPKCGERLGSLGFPS
jgi:hypothetical protein